MVDVTSVTTSNSLHHATYYLDKVISHAPPHGVTAQIKVKLIDYLSFETLGYIS